MTEAEKKFYIDQGIKVGLVVFAVGAIGSYFGGNPGRVDRIEFDLDRTQNRYFATGNPPPNDWDVVSDPWNPSDIAKRLHSAMNGIQLTDGQRLELFIEVNQLGTHRARWLHNYWLAQIDPVETLYRWIDGEMMNVWNEDQQKNTLDKLRAWGIGF